MVLFIIHSLPDIDIIIVFRSTLHCRKIIRLPSQPQQTDVDFINRGFLYLLLFLFYFHVYMLIEHSVSILIMFSVLIIRTCNEFLSRLLVSFSSKSIAFKILSVDRFLYEVITF